MSDYQTERDVYKHFAEKIVDQMWKEMKPYLEEAFIKRIMDMAANGFIYAWEREQIITDIIREEVKKHLQTTFRPMISELAKARARKTIEKRAKQMGLIIGEEENLSE